MLKPSDTWKWYFDETTESLMLDLGNDMVFKTNIPHKMLVDCAKRDSDFCVDDASSYQTFKETISFLGLSEPRQAELALYCVAAKRFHKPVQPKSWFFDAQGQEYKPEEGDIVRLVNQHSLGYFIVLEAGESASLCTYVDLDEFHLSGSKSLAFGDSIKVMHDRLACANHILQSQPIALVG
ncbi:cell division protein ZapC [Vibrio maerlii]|uniref:cell division protein ZapC n=1 Tax=Vibrio maerlii TaxID=2231648 RepID=UPI000E3D1DEB|nr:cell division protein ZapC [Vibrio maerlii]